MRKAGLSEEQVKSINENIRQKIPMDRIGYGEEIAKAALFLDTSDSSYVTGIEHG